MDTAPARIERDVIPADSGSRTAKRPRARGRHVPVHPGHFLDTRYLQPLHITQQGLADAIGVSRRRVNELVRGKRGITADTAVRLAAYFRNEPEFWLQLQLAWDVHRATHPNPRRV
jgi:addiction module HigA family antidote